MRGSVLSVQDNVFPVGLVTADNALRVRGINYQWHSRESLCGVGG
ncbi:hypothetical protein [Stieleria marina]